jgi:drug/metabolite transporter superfamily protein YnfA
VRSALAALLWLCTTVALAAAVPAVWVQTHVIDVNGYTAMARAAAADQTLQQAVASELSTRATLLIDQHGQRVDSQQVHAVAAGYTAGPDFPAQFADANRLAHDWMFTGAHTQADGDQWVVDLAGMLKDSAFADLLTSYHVQVPDTVRVPVTVSTPKVLQPGQLRPLAVWGLWASIGVVALTGCCALLTLAAARSKGRALAALGVSALLVGAAGWAAIELGRRSLNDELNDTTGDIRRIADVMVAQAESGLHHWLNLTLAAGGGLVLLGVLAAGLGSLRRS